MTQAQRLLSAAERLDWLRLIRSENVGPRTFFRLIERFGSAGAALSALPDLAKKGGRSKPIILCPKAVAEKELAAWEAVGARLVASVEPEYPALLASCDDAPPLLGVRGNVHLLAKPGIAIVGARNASINGKRFAQQLAYDLGQGGLVVVSGLARGIDTAAHMGAMPTGTVAAMAGGLDVVYPPENGKLYDDLCAMGAAISEMPPGTNPQASHFPRRNRLVSGMSLGVVVIEATLKSGSLITARLAADQGREVFAVPGSPLDPRAHGPNDLIRNGAVLTESAEDILRVTNDLLRRTLSEARRPDFGAPSAIPAESEIDAARSVVTQALGPSPVMVDEILRQCQLSPAVVSMVLLELELAGRLERHPGSQVSLL